MKAQPFAYIWKGALAYFSPSNYVPVNAVVKMRLSKLYTTAESLYKNYTND